MSLRRKLLIALALVLLVRLYWIGHMVLFDISGDAGRTILLYVIRFAPELIFILLGGLLLGPVWGASVGIAVALSGFVFNGLGIFSSVAFWHFPITALLKYVVLAVCAGIFVKRASSLKQTMLVVFCSLILAYSSEMLITYFIDSYMLPLRTFLEIWVHLHGFGVLLQTIFVPLLYLALKRALVPEPPAFFAKPLG